MDIMIIDDNEIFRRGLVQLIHQAGWGRVVAEADNMEAGVDMLKAQHPDLLILDLYIDADHKCFDHISAIKERLPAMKIIILTVSEEQYDIFEATQYQIDGYLLKSAPFSQLERDIQDIYNGKIIISNSLGGMLFRYLQTRNEYSILSMREREVLALLRQGMTNKSIAQKLFISENTVKIHVSNIFAKLNVKKRSELLDLK